MAAYNLQPNESMVRTHDRVHHGNGLPVYTRQLILTSMNLVLVRKGALGGTKGVLVYPLNQIKVYDGEAQAQVGRQWNGKPTLDIYFLNGQESFGFERHKEAAAWAQAINRVITGNGTKPPTAKGVAATLFGQVVAVKDTYVAGQRAQQAPASLVARECYACGAPLTGTQGQVATCSYCDTPVQL